MMNIAVIDADLIGRLNHRFPNLASMKISGYYKELGHTVVLKTDYTDLEKYDKVFVSKVFTDTPIDERVLNLPNVSYGGTGFFFDKAEPLPFEVEHHMPDYHLYDAWVAEKLQSGEARSHFKEYLDYSIGFLTRGCFRKCRFCVNQKYDRVFCHSSLEEFYDPNRKKICLLDDNFLGSPNWKPMLQTLIDTKKPFKFKQGLDERLLTDEKCEMLFNSRYDGYLTFAFDNVSDYDLIARKLELIRKHTIADKFMFYVLCGFESTDIHDIEGVFKRVALLMKYGCLPYIMRYQSISEAPWKESEFRNLYVAIARWCNQPAFFKKKSFREFCEQDQKAVRTPGFLCSSMRALTDIEQRYPWIAARYFDLKWVKPY